jgi:hypothetical protein
METTMFKKSLDQRMPPAQDSIVELSLMMPRRQFEALEQRARCDGMSIAQFLRRLVKDAVEELPLGSAD